MNTSKLADISEIVSSIAILGTLIFLTIQMHHNTEALQAGQRQVTLAADLQYLNKLIDNPDLALITRKAVLTDGEKVQLHYMLASFFRSRELDWIQYQKGALDETTWKNYQSTISITLSSPQARVWWQKISKLTYDRSFVAHVNKLIANHPVSGQLLALTLFN